MIKKYKILFFCLLVLITKLNAQVPIVNPFIKPVALQLPIKSGFKTTGILLKKQSHLYNLQAGIAADHYAKGLGFFCKQEIKFDRISKMPFRFRLGSVEDCNRLEGKH